MFENQTGVQVPPAARRERSSHHPSTPHSSRELRAAIRSWWHQESADWDAAVEGTGGDVDLWDDLPMVDSKAIVRSSPLFKQYLGVPLDIKLVRKGGYKRIDEAISELVPLMEQSLGVDRSGTGGRAQ